MPRIRRAFVVAKVWVLHAVALPLLCTALPAAEAAQASDANAIIVNLQPIPIDPRRGQGSVGELDYLAGYELTAPDGGWGGFSGLTVSKDGTRLIALSDVGLWLEARLVHEGDRLTGIEDATLAPMLDTKGTRLLGKSLSDAEGLGAEKDGSLLVSFERTNRIYRYRAGGSSMAATIPEAVASPLDRAPLPDNAGAEAIGTLDDGTIFVLTEGAPQSASGDVPGWIGRNGQWSPIHWTRTGLFRVTDATALPDGDLLVLERRYTQIGGPAARLSVVKRADIQPNAHLSGREIALLKLPMNVDNFEGVAVRPGSSGTLIYLISDDNQSSIQRTLLLEFRWLAH